MKKIITTIALGLLSISLSAQVPSYVPTSGLKGWWSFAGNANDLSGNANNGTVSNAVLVTDRFGNPNCAYSFNGTNAQINVPSSSTLVNFPNGQTLSFWMKITSLPTDGKEHYMIDKTDNTAKYYQAFISDFTNVDNIVYRYGQSSTVSSQGTAIPFSNLPINQWFNVCFTTDLTVTKTYINGVLFLTYNQYSPIGINSNPLIFGNTNIVNSTNAPFNGSLDDIGIWDRVLTAAEIANINNSIVPSTQLCLNTITNYAANADPRHAVSSDFNGDGFADLAVANYGSGGGTTISVFIGNGSGNFAPAVNYTAGSGVHGIISADFNADGKIDLATANRSSNNISVLLGNGLGGFATAVNFAVGTNPQSLINADFNGDGNIDLAIANANSNNVSIKLGNGLGSFGTSTNFIAGTAPNSVIAKDFNGDSFVDLAISNGGTNNVSILLGNGLGSFGAATNYTTGIGPSTVISKDFNADGKLDLAVSNLTSNNVSILLGTGTGSFGSVNNFAGGGSQVWAVISEDFDGDGKLDLATANYSASTAISILQGNGAGGFNAAVNFSVVGSGTPVSLISGDFNGDGKKDIATTNYVSNNASVFINCSSITTSIGNLDLINSQHVIKVWPNPTSGHITIDNGAISDVNGYQLKITNTLGQQVFQSTITHQQFNIDLSTSCVNGLYFLQIVDAKGNIIDTKKIVLQ